MPTKLLKMTGLVFATLLILLFDASAQKIVLAQAQPETCDPDASVTVLLRDPDNFESDAGLPFISDDGRYVAYSFRNQISGEWVTIPYRYDRLTCEAEIISITGDTTPYTDNAGSATVWGLSGDGRYAVFEYTTTDTALSGIYIHDMDTGTVEKIPAENAAFVASISRDGRYVLYSVYIPTTSGIPDNPDDRTSLFLYDRVTGQSELIYEAEAGLLHVLFLAALSEDNNHIVFTTNANQIVIDEYLYSLTDVFVYDRGTQELNRITTGSDGSPPYASNYAPTISANGRYVVYSAGDVFVYDQQTTITRRISVAADGTPGNGMSGHEFISISADGRFIAFSSDATNLIVGETHNTRGVYIYDQLMNDLWRVSVADYYDEGIIADTDPMLSRDGQWLAYTTSQQVSGQYGGDLFIVEWQTLIDGEIEEPTPLPAPPQPETCDPDAALTVLLRSPDNSQVQLNSPYLSANGRYVVYNFFTHTPGHIPYRYDRLTCENEIISITGDSIAYSNNFGRAITHDLSADGRYVLFEYNAQVVELKGIYVQDMDTGVVERIPAENPYALLLSADGRFVLYGAVERLGHYSLDRSSLFLYDRNTDETEVIASAESGDISSRFFPIMSEDNSLIVFSTGANLLVPDDTNGMIDMFVYDRAAQTFTRINIGIDGEVAPHNSLSRPDVSADGRYVVYESSASNLVAGDTNGRRDVFVYDRASQTTHRASVATDGTQSNGHSWDTFANISADGRFIAFSSDATNLIVGETHNTRGVYIYDQLTADLWRVSDDDYYPAGNGLILQPVLSQDGQWLAYIASEQISVQFGGDLFIVEWQTLVEGGIEEPTPSAPDASPDRNVVTTGESLLTWGAITWAVGYEIQIDDDANFSSPVASDNALTEIYLTVPDLPEGVYHWRVRAQRSNGSWGGWSVPDSFVVVTP